jgi:lipopolysaccharide export system protein LptC
VVEAVAPLLVDDLPAAQLTQVEEDKYEPAGQLVPQLVAPTVEYVNVAHGAHVDDPTLVEYVPEAQLVQLDEPAADA